MKWPCPHRLPSGAAPTVVLLLFVLTLACSHGGSLPPTQTPSPEGEEIILITGGDFMMGAEGEGDFSPTHRVTLHAFYLDSKEVTNAQYDAFCRETDCLRPEFWGMAIYRSGPQYPDHPVVGVSWGDARAFCEWAGKRLPTEAEWEYAARGGMEGMKYPYGDDRDPEMANYWIRDRVRGPMEVGSFPPNGYGLFDMSGNVAEWVHDFYDGDYYGVSATVNPKGPEGGKFKVIRGGGWRSGPGCTTVIHRNGLVPQWRDINVGFRCAKNVE